MNGARLGIFKSLDNAGLIRKADGRVSGPRSVAAGAIAGICGAFIASPLYLLKTHLQAQAASSIAVGYQHSHNSMYSGLTNIYRQYGIVGLWRGVTAALSRVGVGSAVQLATFSKSKDVINNFQVFERESVISTLLASSLSGVVLVVAMTPFDVVSTRLYNQGVDAAGKGLFYSSVGDCFQKIFFKEGFWSFYKGWSASFLRIGPHTVLSLVFWDELRKLYYNNPNPNNDKNSDVDDFPT